MPRSRDFELLGVLGGGLLDEELALEELMADELPLEELVTEEDADDPTLVLFEDEYAREVLEDEDVVELSVLFSGAPAAFAAMTFWNS